MNRRVLLLIIAIEFLLLQAGCNNQSTAPPEPTSTTIGNFGVTEDGSIPYSADEKNQSLKPTHDLLSDEIDDDELVCVKTYIPDIVIDLKYASTDNFTGLKIYEFSDAYLRYGTIKKLAEVQNYLSSRGLGLKIWDAFRPADAQFRLWDVCPDSTYVANPNPGFSSHSRGNTVDVTLVSKDGQEIQMPTGFDDFTPLADRDYSDCKPTAADNARILEIAMTSHGFNAYFGEWWHFTDTVAYDVEREFYPPG